MVNILDLRHSSKILLFLLQNGQIKKTELLSVISSSDSLSSSLRKMDEEGLIKIETKVIGRKTIFISLTEKGRELAEQLKKAEEMVTSPAIENKKIDDLDLTMTDEEAEMAKHLNLLFHINVMDDHITVEEVKPGKPSRIFNIYVKRNGNAEFRLWCEHDDSYDCWHVKAAWTYPHVQKMMMHYRGKVKVCRQCGFENPEIAVYCMKCAMKLE